MLLVLCLVGFVAVATAQTALTNDDVVKLARSGLSEEFILNLIQQQPARFSTDVSQLVELKTAGVSEPVIGAIVRKTPPPSPLTADGVMQLTRSEFSEKFILDLLNRQPAKFALNAQKIVQLKQAGVSERVISALVSKGSYRELPSGTEITVRLIDSIDSENNNEGDKFKASLEDPLTLDDQVACAERGGRRREACGREGLRQTDRQSGVDPGP